MPEEKIIGIFKTQKKAQHALDALHILGYESKNIHWKKGITKANYSQAAKVIEELKEMYVPEEEARLYIKKLKMGEAFLGIGAETESDVQKIIEILIDNGATDIRTISGNLRDGMIFEIEGIGLQI